MNIENVLNANFLKKEGKQIIQDTLKKIKPFRKYAGRDVPLEDLEKILKVLTRKYSIKPQWISFNYAEDLVNCIYSCSMITSDKKAKWLGTVYGCCIYELFAKMVIKIFYEVKHNEDVKVR